MTFIPRTLYRGAGLAGAATIAAALVSPGIASADELSPMIPPEVTFTTGDDSITATIHNPNDRSVCYLTIVLKWGHTTFTDDQFLPADQKTIWPGPGETSTYMHYGLEPGVYRLTGVCGQEPSSAYNVGIAVEEYEVRVGPAPDVPASPACSLGSTFGSLS